jgi:hypothetical protein
VTLVARLLVPARIDESPGLEHDPPMKTTIDIPEALYRRAEILAAEQATSLEEFVVESLKQALSGAKSPAGIAPEQDPLLAAKASGVPTPQEPDDVAVTEEVNSRIRAKEGL